jgi:hypothetical protein
MTSAAPDTPSPRPRTWAFALLTLLGLVLALRLSLTEVVRETLAQKQSHLLARIDPSRYVDLPFVGPAVTTGFAGLTLLLAAGAAALASAAGALSTDRILRWLLIAAVAILGWCSVLAAANRFAAVVGLSDLVAVLAAGWAASLLCHQRLAGDRGRRLLVALFVAVLAAWVAKGLMQRFVDHPDTLAAFLKDRDQILRDQGIAPDSPGAVAYENRLRSAEVTGFLTLANVTAAGLVGLLTVLTGVLAALVAGNARQRRDAAAGDVPTWAIYAVAAGAVLVLGVWVLLMTYSNGGAAMGVLCCAAAAAGVFLQPFVSRWRRVLVTLVVVGFVAGMVVVVGYGVHYGRLPSKSLLFRWYYWSAGAQLVHEHPALGVGLNNFGSYYTSVKNAAAPEDVADPHSFFVRLSAELGVPAAVLIAVLVVWTMLSATRAQSAVETPPESPRLVNVMVVAGVLSLAWWLAQYLIAGPYDVYFLALALLSAVLTAAAGTATFSVLAGALPSTRMRALLAAALVGAFGMFVYDQINMALVTGPVAMLFWVLLGFADSGFAPAARRTVAGPALALLTAAGGVGVLGFVWLPVIGGTMRWDPAPHEFHFLQAINARDPASAEAALDQALARSSRSMDLLRERIGVRRQLHEPVADDIRRVLALDRANARVRLAFALPPSDLPDAERARALWEALRFDALLAPDEPKRLSAQERQQIIDALKTLDPAGSYDVKP